MNTTVFASGNEVFKNCECIKGFAFKIVATRGKSALFAALSSKSQDNCDHFEAVTNLLPHHIIC